MNFLPQLVRRQACTYHPLKTSHLAARSYRGSYGGSYGHTIASRSSLVHSPSSKLLVSPNTPFHGRYFSILPPVVAQPVEGGGFQWQGVDFEEGKVFPPSHSEIQEKKEEAAKIIASVLQPTVFEMEVKNFQNEVVDKVEVSSEIFCCPIRRDILHQVVVWQLACRRSGTASAKSRGEVRGSTRKLRPQKGLGRARVGSARPPHFRGGGVAFPPKPRDFSYPLPRKVQDFGLRVALSTKFAQGKLWVVDNLDLPTHKTKDFQQLREARGWNKNSLLMITGSDEVQKNLHLATSNIRGVEVFPKQELNVYAILCNDLLILEKSVIAHLHKTLLR